MYNVLILEDETYISSLLQSIIPWNELNLRPQEAVTNGKEALKIINQKKVDILLSDIRVPGMDGLSLLREIKRNNMKIKTIFISGYDDFSYAQEAIRLGAIDYILKPVETEALKSALQKAIGLLDKEKKNIEYVSKLKQEISKLQSAENEENEGTVNNTHIAIAKAINFIEENYNRSITLEETAGAVFMSSTYLSKLFKTELNVGFSDYLTDYRIEKAKLLLKQPFLKINEIANLVGYTDPAYFNRVFKARTGKTPSEYKDFA